MIIEIEYCFFTDESYFSILCNKNGVVIPLMTDIDEPFRGVDRAFKPFVEKLIPIYYLPP